MKPPRIIVYQTCDATRPPDAMMFAAAMCPDGRPGTSWMATGATPDEARAKLEAVWAKQFPATSNRGAHFRKPMKVDEVDLDEIIL